MESSSQISHFEELRDRLLVEYREFLKASRTGGADGVDADTGELDGKYRFAGYTAIGSAYAPDNGILFVSLDIGADPGPRRPEDIRKEFLELIDAAREEGSSPEIWRSHHPAWPRWATAGRFVAGTDKWQAEKLRDPRGVTVST